MKTLFVLFSLGFIISCNMKNPNCDTSAIMVRTLNQGDSLSAWCDGHAKMGDTVMLKNVVSRHMNGIPWYGTDHWELDLHSPFKRDTTITTAKHDTFTFYVRGVVVQMR